MSLEWGPLGPIEVLATLELNFEVDSTSHYRESIEFQYPIKITRHYMLESITC